MFKISGPGVYRRRNGEVIEIAKFSKSELFSVWLKKGSEFITCRESMQFYDSFCDNGRCDALFCTPFDLVELVKLVSPTPPNPDHWAEVETAQQNFAAAFSDVPAAGTMETSSDRLGPRLRYRTELLVNDSVPIAEAIQFVIQKCGIPAVTEALILSRNQKEAFHKLFAEAVGQTVKRGIHSNAEVTVTFL